MTVFPIPAFSDNYIWAIIDEEARLFDCVDPGEAVPVLDFAQKNQLSLRAILLTHHHNDHIGGVGELVKAFPSCAVYAPHDSRIPTITKPVSKDDLVTLGKNQYQVLSNPGHTSTHISFFEPKQQWLFCGDTLFSAGCGRVFDGTMEELHQSLQMFKNLPPATQVFCGHEYTRQNLRFAETVEPQNKEIKRYMDTLHQQPQVCSLPSTIELERKVNPFFRTEEPDVVEFARKQDNDSSRSLDVFRVLRNAKDVFK